MLEPIGRSAGCPRVRGQCVNAKSDQRAQGNRKRPTGSGPSARLINGLLSHRGSASRAARTIIPATASPGSPSTTTRPRPQQATAPHPGPGFSRECDHPQGDEADNTGKTSQIAKDGLTLARRFRDHEDMILRFATDLAVGFTSNQAERDVRPVKVQQRTSGGTWRTLLGLADFAIVQSYLSTAGKWGIDALDALTRLFTDGPWLPPATASP